MQSARIGIGNGTEWMEKTIENLAKALVGESRARSRCTYYASAVRGEGYEQIAEVLLLTADPEKSHARNM